MQQNKITIRNQSPQEISISNANVSIAGVTDVLQNGDSVVSDGIARVTVPTEMSQLTNDVGYITSETDPTVPSIVKSITGADINSWNNKQDLLVNQVNIKSINNNSILGSGNLTIQEGINYTAGTGIEIQNNVISNTIVNFDDLQNKPTIPTKTSDLSNDSNYVSSNELSEVAFTGDYEDLTNLPFIPSYLSDLGNDVGFITNSVDDLINYYNKDFLYNLLPKVSDSGSALSLSQTYASKLQMTLNATELSQDGTPTPSSPQEVHTISGSNKVVVCGKNLFDNANVTLGKTWNDTSSAGRSVYYLQTEANKTYTLFAENWNSLYYDIVFLDYIGASSFIYESGWNDPTTTPKKTFTTSAGTNILCIHFKYQSAGTTTMTQAMFDNATIGLYNGEITNPTYEPYISQEADIDLDTLEYCKIGNYEDKFIRSNDGTWQLEKNIGKVVLDGTENWQVVSRSNGYQFQTSNSLGKLIPNTEIGMLSNYFKGIKFSDRDSINESIYAYNADSDIRILTNVESTTANFKTWLSTHNTTVYYVLATPTYTQITGSLANQLENIYKNLLSYNGSTNISQVNADLPFQITATTLKDISNL